MSLIRIACLCGGSARLLAGVVLRVLPGPKELSLLAVANVEHLDSIG